MDMNATIEEIFREMRKKNLSPPEQLVYLAETMREQLLMAADLAKEQRSEELGLVINTVTELNKKAGELREQVQNEPITKADVQALRNVQPHRKSVQNMLDTEVAQTTKFEALLGEEMGKKSAYEMRNSDNVWREDASKTVPIIEIQKRDIPENLTEIRKRKDIPRGTFVNRDTGIEIVFGQKSIDETVAKAIPDKKRGFPVTARMAALFQMKNIIENAVCFDSRISNFDDETSKGKSPNTLFIHRFHEIVNCNGKNYLANLSVEENYIADKENRFTSTSNRLYSFRDIEIAPLEANRIFSPATDNKNVTADTSIGANVSIAQLYQIVKTYDKSFFENLDAIGRAERLEEIAMHEAYDKAVTEYNEARSKGLEGGNAISSQYGNVTNTYSGKEFEVMENLKIFEQDNRSLQQWLDDYEAQKKEVEEKALEEISTEEGFEQLPVEDKQLVEDYNANKALLVEARMSLDYVKSSTVVRLDADKNPQCQSLMNSKEEYAHAITVLTGGFDERMGKLLETTRDKTTADRYTGFANAPLMDKAISELIQDEISSGVLTVSDLVGVIADTREQRESLRISDNNITKDTMSAITYDKDKLHEFDFEYASTKEAPEIVESNDGYVMNTSRVTAENERGIGEKVNGNEVVHNEAPHATTTDPSKAGGNVKLEEANDKGTEDKKKQDVER